MKICKWALSPVIGLLACSMVCLDANAQAQRGAGRSGRKPAGGLGKPGGASFTSGFGKGAVKKPGAAASGLPRDRGTRNDDFDVDTDVDVRGNPKWGHSHSVPESWAYAVAVPPCAAVFGVYPAYYSWYYPPTSTASVTYVHPDATTARPSSSTVIVNSSIPADPSAQAPVEAYPAAITSAMESLEQRPDAAQFMRDGTRLFFERDYAGAAERFRRAIPLDIDNGLPRFSYAHALFALGDYENASYNIRRGLDLMPDWVTSGNNMRALYGNPTDFEDQRAALGAHIRSNPNDYEAWVTLGYFEFFSGSLEGADRAFRMLAETNPDDPIGPHFLAEVEKIQQHLAAQEER